MFKRISAAVTVLFCIALLPARAMAQQDTSITVIELKLRDGSRFYGSVERQDSDVMEFLTLTGGRVTVKRTDVVTMKKVSGMLRKGEFLPDDPLQSRLFFG